MGGNHHVHKWVYVVPIFSSHLMYSTSGIRSVRFCAIWSGYLTLTKEEGRGGLHNSQILSPSILFDVSITGIHPGAPF